MELSSLCMVTIKILKIVFLPSIAVKGCSTSYHPTTANIRISYTLLDLCAPHEV